MTKSGTFTESALPEAAAACATERTDQARLEEYQALALVFAYPAERTFKCFPQFRATADAVRAEYDRLFRAGIVWLESAEHAVSNEFERARMLADIMGFYQAFGTQPCAQRPDTLPCELEFMRYLIFKRLRAEQGLAGGDSQAKSEVCRAAEKKFFTKFIAPTAPQIARMIIATSGESFYREAAEALLSLVDREQKWFGAAEEPATEVGNRS